MNRKDDDMNNFIVTIFKDGEILYPVQLTNGDKVIITRDQSINLVSFINEGRIPTYSSFDDAIENFFKSYKNLIPKNSTIYIVETNNDCTEIKHYKYLHYLF